jgi:hypothetical protein
MRALHLPSRSERGCAMIVRSGCHGFLAEFLEIRS